MDNLKILTYLPHFIHPYGIGYAAHCLSLGMNDENVVSDMFSIHSEMANQSPHVKQAFNSKITYKLAAKLMGNKWVTRYTENKFRRLVKQYDVAYLWPGCSLETYKYLKAIGKKIIIENINCHQGISKKILDNEAKSLGLKNIHLITNESIDDEDQKLQLADFVYSPSPQVTQSLLDMNVPENKIIESSYGLDQSDILQSSYGNKAKSDAFTVIFVGSVIPRKGIHLLLDYWTSAKLNGQLKVIGKVDESAQSIVNLYKDEPSIEFISFTNDLTSHYRSADLFMMPSLEEGSPLVTYLAVGAGLPCLVSPMAGDGVVRNNIDGFIIPPHDKSAWVAALQKMAADPKLRIEFSKSVKTNAENFLWPAVARRRIDELCNRLGMS